MKSLAAKKAQLLLQIQASQRASIGVTVVDGYVVKATDFYTGEFAGYGFADPHGRW